MKSLKFSIFSIVLIFSISSASRADLVIDYTDGSPTIGWRLPMAQGTADAMAMRFTNTTAVECTLKTVSAGLIDDIEILTDTVGDLFFVIYAINVDGQFDTLIYFKTVPNAEFAGGFNQPLNVVSMDVSALGLTFQPGEEWGVAVTTDPNSSAKGEILTFASDSGTKPSLRWYEVPLGGNWQRADCCHGGIDVNMHIYSTISTPPLNSPPLFTSIFYDYQTDEGNLAAIPIEATDPDQDYVTLTLGSNSFPPDAYLEQLTGNSGFAELIWQTDFTDSGFYSAEILADDGKGEIATATYTLTVNNVNQPPVFLKTGDFNVNEGGEVRFTVTANDIDDDPIILEIQNTNIPAGEYSFELFRSEASGEFTWPTDFADSGNYFVKFAALSNESSATDSVNISVTNLLCADLAVSSFALSGVPSVSTNLNLFNRLILNLTNVGETDGTDSVFIGVYISVDSIITTSDLLLTGGREHIGPIALNDIVNTPVGGTIPTSFINSQAYLGIIIDELEESSECNEGNNTAWIAVNVVLNNFPVVSPINDTIINEGDDLNLVITAYDTDLEPFFIEISNPPSGSSFNDNGDGTASFSWTPGFNDAGVYDVVFAAVDQREGRGEDTVQIAVRDVNQAPVLDSIGDQFVNENDTLRFFVTASDFDDDAISMNIVDSDLPDYDFYQVSTKTSFQTYEFLFVPTFDDSGTYTATFVASDEDLEDSQVVKIQVNNINRQPVVETGNEAAIDEGQTLQYVISGFDPDGDSLTYFVETDNLPSSYIFEDSGNGKALLEWTPTFDDSGHFEILIYLDDNHGEYAELTFLITVNNVNRPPVFDSIGNKEVFEDQQLDFTVNVTDPDDDFPISIQMFAPTLPDATFQEDGDVPRGDFSLFATNADIGVHQVIFRADDLNGGIEEDTIFITVKDFNFPPAFFQISDTLISELDTLELAISTYDEDGDPIVLSVFDTDIFDGELFDNGDGTGTFTWYTDNFDEGTYYLILRAESFGGLFVHDTINITVQNVPLPPVLFPIGDKSVNEGDSLLFTVTGTDPDDAATRIEMISTNLPIDATFGDPDYGVNSFYWQTTFVDSGTYSATFIIYDADSLSDSETIVIIVNNVNQPPILNTIGTQEFTEGIQKIFVIDAFDADGAIPLVTASNLPNGALLLYGDAPYVDWTPGFDQAGDYFVTIYATDDQNAVDSEIVLFSVTDVNRPPVLDLIGPQTFFVNQYREFDVTGSDPDNNENFTFYTSVMPEGAGFFTFTGLGPTFGRFSWQPTAAQVGIYTVTFYMTDGIETDSEVVLITVDEVACSDLTVSSFTLDGPQQISRDRRLERRINLTLENLGPLSVDSQTTIDFYYSSQQWGVYLLGSQVVNSVELGLFDVEITDPVVMQADADLGPAYLLVVIGESGYLDCNPQNNIDSIPFDLVDNIFPVLDPIGAQPPIDEGQTISFGLSGSDFDGDPLSYDYFSTPQLPGNPIFVDSGNGSGYFEWTPGFNDNGVYSVTFVLYDNLVKSGGSSDQETVVITVNNVNRPPVLNTIGPQTFLEKVYGQFEVSGNDPDGDNLVFSSTTVPESAEFYQIAFGRALFAWTPNATQAGNYLVTFYLSDGVETDSEQVVITVDDNPCPDFSIEVFSLDGPQQISFDRLIQNRINLEVQNSGELGIFDSVALEFYVSSDSNFLNCDCNIDAIGFQVLDSVPVGSQFEVVLEQDLELSSDGNVGYGDYWLCVVIDQFGVYGDCEFSNNYFVIPITVDNNITPILDPIGDKEVNEGDTLGFVVSAIDWDFDEIYLDYYVNNNCECIDVIFVDSGNGHASFEWAPGFNLAGDYAFEFYAYDNYKSGDQKNITIKVNNTNRAPDIDSLPDTLVINEGDKIGFRVSASDPDDDCFELVLESPDLPPSAVFDYVFDCVDYGDFYWVPAFNDAGIYHAIYVVTDEFGGRGEEEVVLVINNINGPPQFDEIPFQYVNENDTFDFQISATDIDGTIPSISTDQLPVGASFVDNGNGTGTFNWATDCSQSGEYSIRCYAADDSGLVDTSFIYLEVGEACDLQLTVVTSPCVQCSPPLAFTDILVSDNGFAIEFNKYLDEGSISENIFISSVRGDELYYQYDIKNKSIIIRSEFGEFVPIDTIFVTLSTGIYDLDESSLDSNYNLTYTVGPVVYPGDCNNDGIVNEVDVLWIGIYWNQDGPDRFVGGEYGPLEFFAQPAHFQEQGNGEWENRNAVYADVDGSGMIDAYDLCGVAINFAKNSYEDVLPKGSDASSGTASMGGLNSKVLEEMRLALIECPESAPKARILEAIENAIRASTAIFPKEIELHQNYPNPFNPSTTIEFYLPKAENTTLSIYNMLGQEVITLLDEKVEAGYKEVVWSGKDKTGHQVASGIYFYKLTTETKEIIKRMLLVK